MSVVDVRAVDAHGKVFTVEVQSSREPAFADRALNYWSAANYRQIEAGTPFTALKPTVGVNILDYVMFSGRKHLHTSFVLTAADDPGFRLTDALLIHVIELPKLAQRDTREAAASLAALSPLEKWVYFLRRRGDGTMTDDPILKQILDEEPDIRKAEERYRQFLADPQVRSRYRARDRWQRQQATRMVVAREEGRSEGIELGIGQGRAENARQNARRLKEKGVDRETIAYATGLSTEEIDAL